MAIPNTRTTSSAEITIHEEKCNGCGLCVEVCSDFGLSVVNKKVTLSDRSIFGCIGCGHCMAVCPEQAIEIHGRTLSPGDIFTLPERRAADGYEQLLSLLQARRATREFKNICVEKDLVEKILDAARAAPMGIPPSDVNVLVFDNPEKVRNFSKSFCEYLESIQWLASKWFLTLARPFMGKTNYDMFNNFVKPLINEYINSMKKGVDMVTYGAPLAMYFYGSPFSDPADPLIPATYAMLAGESLGLSTCMLGAIHPFIQDGNSAAIFRKKHGIKYKSREGIFVIFGYPKVKYKRGINRTMASITYHD